MFLLTASLLPLEVLSPDRTTVVVMSVLASWLESKGIVVAGNENNQQSSCTKVVLNLKPSVKG
jgi:hypothetical protein